MIQDQDEIKILELFGGIGSPRCALRNLGIKTKAIDYVEIDEAAVRSYNAMFESELPYKTQSVVGWNLKPDILIHGSPCQDFSIAGQQKGAEEGSETRSSLMWETIHIIDQMGEWKPKFVIWENVKNVRSKHMIANFNRYISEMARMGYTSSFETLDAREFGLPQARERVFTVSVLDGQPFQFDDLIRTPMKNIHDFLLDNDSVPEVYNVTQPSVYNVIGKKGIKRATVIEDFAYTITTRQDRTPAQCATMQCSCDEAAAYQESAQRRETAKQRVKELFGDGAGEFKANEELQQIMCAAVDQICNKQTKQFVITIRSGVKCRIMQMAKDKIKVVREATSTSSFEQ